MVTTSPVPLLVRITDRALVTHPDPAVLQPLETVFGAKSLHMAHLGETWITVLDLPENKDAIEVLLSLERLDPPAPMTSQHIPSDLWWSIDDIPHMRPRRRRKISVELTHEDYDDVADELSRNIRHR